jgi:hypothetical protein
MTRSWSIGTLVVSTILLIFTYYAISLFLKNDITFYIETTNWVSIFVAIATAMISLIVNYRARKKDEIQVSLKKYEVTRSTDGGEMIRAERINEEKKGDKR